MPVKVRQLEPGFFVFYIGAPHLQTFVHAKNPVENAMLRRDSSSIVLVVKVEFHMRYAALHPITLFLQLGDVRSVEEMNGVGAHLCK